MLLGPRSYSGLIKACKSLAQKQDARSMQAGAWASCLSAFRIRNLVMLWHVMAGPYIISCCRRQMCCMVVLAEGHNPSMDLRLLAISFKCLQLS